MPVHLYMTMNTLSKEEVSWIWHNWHKYFWSSLDFLTYWITHCFNDTEATSYALILETFPSSVDSYIVVLQDCFHFLCLTTSCMLICNLLYITVKCVCVWHDLKQSEAFKCINNFFKSLFWTYLVLFSFQSVCFSVNVCLSDCISSALCELLHAEKCICREETFSIFTLVATTHTTKSHTY